MKRIPSPRSTPQPPAIRTLDACPLDAVRGGHSIISPRDPQSGLPSGQDT
jgi:hypothetical protein